MNFIKQPVARDTTIDSAGEVLRRFATLVWVLGGIGGPVLAGWAWMSGARGLAWVGGVCFGIGAALFLTRRWWLGAEGATATAAAADPAEGDATIRSGARPRILLINGSLAGEGGNSARLLAKLEAELAGRAQVERAALAGTGARGFAELAGALGAADGLVIATGTHWDSWSSPLQKFLEDATPSEATGLWLGKPVAVLVSEHSTGGKGVLSRLQGVLVTFGCVVPPLSGLVVSRSAQIARRHAPAEAEDFWGAEDLAVIAYNLAAAARQRRAAWRAWRVARAECAKWWVVCGCVGGGG